VEDRSAPDEHELIARARGGDAHALEELLEAQQGRVYRFGLRMCGDAEDARDVLQDTLLAAARGIGEFRGDASLSSWLYSIARSHCGKRRRRSKFAPERELSLDAEAPEAAFGGGDTASPEAVLAGREIEAALAGAIAELEPTYREVLVLRDVEGLTAPEVAQVLGLGVPAVKSRLHRARRSVRERVAPLLGIPTEVPASAGSCPDVLELFSRHLEGELSARLCADMDAHLQACPRCRGACESLRRTLALCKAAAPSPRVPLSVQTTVKAALHDFLMSEKKG